MTENYVKTFQKALDVVESLPEEQQETLIDIIRRRLVEHKREVLAEHIRQAREEYRHGKVKRGTVKDIMKEITE
jgi:ribosomal protein S4